MTSQVFPASVELSSKAMGSVGPLKGHEAFEPPSGLHASYPPAPGEDPGGTAYVTLSPLGLREKQQTNYKCPKKAPNGVPQCYDLESLQGPRGS